MKILGISAYYHDSAAALIEDGEIIAAAQEERFTRKKHDSSFPINSIKSCLQSSIIKIDELDAIVFYDKPFLKFERILQTYMDTAPKGLFSFLTSMPSWLKEKLFLKSKLKKSLAKVGFIDWNKTSLLFSEHHLSHAASAFFTSSFQQAAILIIDGVGEWATASIHLGEDNKIEKLAEMDFPHSIGLLYSAFTYFLGFKVNNGEYKVMGLAPYADREANKVLQYVEDIKNNIVTINEDGSIFLNQDFFAYTSSLKMIHKPKFEALFNFKKRNEDEAIEEEHYSLAAALQIVIEDITLKMTRHAKSITNCDNLCLAGGVALNCVANGKIQENQIFKNIFIQPAAGDAGGALGAALAAHYLHCGGERKIIYPDSMQMARLGPSFNNLEVLRAIEKHTLNYKKLGYDEIINTTAQLIKKGNVVAWFQGKMEFGPRALGGRSILGNPLLKQTQSILNLKVKKRESFRPFAPIMLEEEFKKYFVQDHISPYMLLVHKINKKYRKVNETRPKSLIEKINQSRSVFPAISHVDFSSRIQTVNEESDKKMFDLLNKFKKITNHGVLVNTSFNRKGEPIVCNPTDAINCFLSTDIDYLVIENFLIKK